MYFLSDASVLYQVWLKISLKTIIPLSKLSINLILIIKMNTKLWPVEIKQVHSGISFSPINSYRTIRCGSVVCTQETKAPLQWEQHQVISCRHRPEIATCCPPWPLPHLWSNSVEPAGHTTAGIADWWHTAAAVAAAAAVVVVVAASSPAVPSSVAGRPVVVQQFGHSSIAATHNPVVKHCTSSYVILWIWDQAFIKIISILHAHLIYV